MDKLVQTHYCDWGGFFYLQIKKLLDQSFLLVKNRPFDFISQILFQNLNIFNGLLIFKYFLDRYIVNKCK